MRTHYQDRKDTEIEGYPVWIARYSLGNGYVTEIGCKKSGEILARGCEATSEESFLFTLEMAIRRLRRIHTFYLTVGG
jgi:hypothetical protein